MPKKLLPTAEVPTLVLERLHAWGRGIRKQRVAQQIRADDLCTRMGIARTTLRRLERGEAGAAVDLYLNAMLILGIFDFAAPPLPGKLWQDADPNSRARRAGGDDDDYF